MWTDRSRRIVVSLVCVLCGVVSATYPALARAQAQTDASAQDLGAIGNKLANPLSNLWALSASFNAPQFFDGDANTGDDQSGGVMIFQPVMPIPLMEKGTTSGG